jgi:hypothetical protein
MSSIESLRTGRGDCESPAGAVGCGVRGDRVRIDELTISAEALIEADYSRSLMKSRPAFTNPVHLDVKPAFRNSEGCPSLRGFFNEGLIIDARFESGRNLERIISFSWRPKHTFRSDLASHGLRQSPRTFTAGNGLSWDRLSCFTRDTIRRILVADNCGAVKSFVATAVRNP